MGAAQAGVVVHLDAAGLGLALALAAGLVIAREQPGPPPTDELPHGLPVVVADGLPLGLPDSLPTPPGNPYTPAAVALGRRLFFDPLLSRDHSVSCATCHRPELGFASDEALSLGVAGRRTERNVPTLFNRAFAKHFMWDGSAATLESQVVMPIENELEMDLGLEGAVARLREHAEYPALFDAAYGEPPSAEHLGRALATFVRGLVTGDSPVDRFRTAGEQGALSETERTGMWIFDSKGGCWQCHLGPNFSDEEFHNTGVGVVDGVPLTGRFAVTGDEADRGRFKTPTLRALSKTAPYMHDGSLESLADVVEFYRRGGNANGNLDPRLKPIELSEREAAGLVAFLEALSRAAD